MKNSTLAIVCAALALAACGQTTKTDEAPPETIPALLWIPIAQTGDGGAILYDPALTKVDATGKLTDVAVRIRHPRLEGWAQDLPKDYAGETVFQTEQATLRFDCAARTMGVVSREALGRDDAVIDRRVTPEPVTLAPLSAGGVAEAVYPKVCAPVAP
ncbi:MAG: hypothetical protein SGJ23_15335 [Alphaproteobacteria bacterium]|nr:hypothetical protein [Alphaproteobacteria bacterium]